MSGSSEGVAINGAKSVVSIFAGLAAILGAVVIPAALAFVWLGRMQVQVEDNLKTIATLSAEVNALKSETAVIGSRQDDVRSRLLLFEELLRNHDQRDAPSKR